MKPYHYYNLQIKIHTFKVIFFLLKTSLKTRDDNFVNNLRVCNDGFLRTAVKRKKLTAVIKALSLNHYDVTAIL